MLTGLIRPREIRTFDLVGESLEDISRQAVAQTPAGWELLSAPVQMAKNSTSLRATATIARRDGIRAIEADDMPALVALVPDDWQLLSVR